MPQFYDFTSGARTEPRFEHRRRGNWQAEPTEHCRWCGAVMAESGLCPTCVEAAMDESDPSIIEVNAVEVVRPAGLIEAPRG